MQDANQKVWFDELDGLLVRVRDGSTLNSASVHAAFASAREGRIVIFVREFIGILPDKFCDRMLTGAFYSAVHAIEALIAFDGQTNHTSHETRNDVLKSVRRYQQIWRHYRE